MATTIEKDLNFKATELCLGLPGASGGGGGKSEEVVEAPKGGGGGSITGKRGFSETVDYLKLNIHGDDQESSNHDDNNDSGHVHVDLNDNVININVVSSKEKLMSSSKPPAKAQVVGWPPVRSYRKNIMAQKSTINEEDKAIKCKSTKNTTTNTNIGAFVKVSMDGAPFLRKVDIKVYESYQDLSDALAKMFSSFTMGNYGTNGMIDFMNESKLMDLLNSSEYVPTYEDKDGDWMLVGDVPWEMFVDSCKRLRIMKGSEAIGLAPRAMEKCKSRA